MRQSETYVKRSSFFETLSFTLPPNWHVDVAEPQPVEPLSVPEAGVAAALANPLQSPPLAQLVGPGDQVCVVFTHPITPCPDYILVPALLHELEMAGVRDHDITVLCANDRYERTSHDDKIDRLGKRVVERYRVLDHNLGEVIHLGQWQGLPLTVNRHLLEADLTIATGVVAPHLYAGYSGGAETVALGCAGEATLEALYAPRLLSDPRTRPGQVRGNPFQEAMQQVAGRAGLSFVLNVILTPSGQIVEVQAGDPLSVHQHLIFAASSLYTRPVPQTYDVVVVGLDPLYDTNLYEAILGPLLVGLAPAPAIRPGGAIILPARIPDGIGQSLNAQNFFSAAQSIRASTPSISSLSIPSSPSTSHFDKTFRPGEARAFQLARLLEQNQVIVVGSEFPALVEASHLQTAPNMDEAIELSGWLLGDALQVLVLPHARHAMPLPPPSEWNGQQPYLYPNARAGWSW